MNLNIFNEIAESELGKRTRRKPNMSSNAIEFRRRQKERREWVRLGLFAGFGSEWVDEKTKVARG